MMVASAVVLAGAYGWAATSIEDGIDRPTAEVVIDIDRGAAKPTAGAKAKTTQTIHPKSRKMRIPCLPNHHPPKDLDLATP